MPRALMLTSFLASLAACSILTGPGKKRVIGVIDAGIAETTIVAPDTVQIGDSFTAIVNSFGSSTCTTPDGVELTLSPLEAHVIPYDLVPNDDPDVICTTDMIPHSHPVELRFTQEGVARIVAEGYVFVANVPGRTSGSVIKELVVVP